MPDLACAAAAARTTPLAPIRPAISISTRVIRLLTTPILGSEAPGDFSRVNPLALPRARRERPRSRAAQKRDEVAPLHCLMLPVLSTERIAHLATAQGRFISIQPMSQMGSFAPIDTAIAVAACRFTPRSD